MKSDSGVTSQDWDVPVMMLSDNTIMHCISLRTTRQTTSAAAALGPQSQQQEQSWGGGRPGCNGRRLGSGGQAKAQTLKLSKNGMQRQETGDVEGAWTVRLGECQWSFILHQRQIRGRWQEAQELRQREARVAEEGAQEGGRWSCSQRCHRA